MSPPSSSPPPPGLSTGSRCPTDDELTRYLEGSLSVQVSGTIEAHLDECADCYQVVASLARGTTDTSEERPVSSAGSSQVDELRRLREARPLSAGTALGRFVVLEWLGEGASGIVYAAYDAQLDRKIALKLLRSRSAGDLGPTGERALDEARAMSKAAHPNVVVIHEVGVFAGQAFIAMEFVAGVTLREWLDVSAREVREILRVFLDAGRGLAAAHDAGVVHRDFKPTNVLIGDDGRVRVTDFGIAVSAAVAPRARPSIVGTPAFMSPEQKRGESSDGRSDQYSFCVALLAALRDTPLPQRLRAALRRGTSERPADRFASMSELLRALTLDPRQRRGFPLVIGTAIAIAIAAGSLAFAYRERHARTANVCRGAEQQLVGIWDARRKSEVERAFLATGKPYAQDQWRSVSRTLDGYAADWVAAHNDACEATSVRHEQSTTVLDRRMACLDARLKTTRSLVQVFSSADAPVVTQAVAATQALPSLAACADLPSLESASPAPSDGALASEVASIREQVALAKITASSGHDREASRISATALERARRTGFAPVVAEALLERGGDQIAADERDEGQRALYEAVWRADESGQDQVRAQALSLLVYTVGASAGAGDVSTLLENDALMALRRAGGGPSTEATIHLNAGDVLLVHHHLAEARRELAAGLALYQSEVPAPPADATRQTMHVAAARNELATVDLVQGDLTAALEGYDQMLREALPLVGETHPVVGRAYGNRALVRSLGLDFAGAVADSERAAAIFAAASGTDSREWALATGNEAHDLVELGNDAEAAALAERALPVLEKTSIIPEETGFVRGVLGRAHLGLGDAQRAREELEAALASPQILTPTDDAPVDLDLARLLATSSPARARALADKALALYAAAPALPRYIKERAATQEWLKSR